MLLTDINVLIYPHVEDSTLDHPEYAGWLTPLATGVEPFALSVLILSGLVRITTNAQVLDPPLSLETAFAFVSSLVEGPTARIVASGPERATSSLDSANEL